MLNMRWVTMKPPKMLTDAKVTARKPKSLERFMSLGPAASSAPTMITEEMALVTAIRGK